MKTLQFYKYACLALVLLNISILVFFYASEEKHTHETPVNKPKIKIDRLLEMSDEQYELFHSSASAHSKKIASIDNEQRMLLSTYFQGLTAASKTMHSDTLLNRLDQLNRRKIEVTYQHFKEVKAFLNEDQQGNFKIFLDEILDRIILKKGKGLPSPPPAKRPKNSKKK